MSHSYKKKKKKNSIQVKSGCEKNPMGKKLKNKKMKIITDVVTAE